MSPPAALTIAPPARASSLHELCEALGNALLGRDPHCHGPWHPRVTPALSAGAAIRPVALGEGLWAVIRQAPDDDVQVLCIHNITDQPLAVTPARHLPDWTNPAEHYFVCGACCTTEDPDGVVVSHLSPHGYLWLARIPA